MTPRDRILAALPILSDRDLETLADEAERLACGRARARRETAQARRPVLAEGPRRWLMKLEADERPRRLVGAERGR